jgi:hypothetical protein
MVAVVMAQLVGLVVAEAVISDQVVLAFLEKAHWLEAEMETLN